MPYVPRTFLLPRNLYLVAKDLFPNELSKNIIEFTKAKPRPNTLQEYYITQKQPSEDVSWWLSYTGVPRVEKMVT